MPIEDDVRRSLLQRVESVDADPEPSLGPPSRQRRRGVRIATICFALVLAASSAAFLIAHGWHATPTAPASTGTPSTPASSAWIKHVDDSGVSIYTPAAWVFNGDPVPDLASPSLLFAVGTGPVPSGGQCAPNAALHALPRDGALFVIFDYGRGHTKDFPPRPAIFHLGRLSGPSECWGIKTYTTLFEDGGRGLQVQVVLGPDAPASLRGEVLRSLDSLQVEPVSASGA
jgi:hypothetical protein